MKTNNKIIANLGRDGISTLWATLLCVYLMIIELLCFFADSWNMGWMNNLSILGTIPEALLWYWICKKMHAQQTMRKDLYVLIMSSYGLFLLFDILSFSDITEIPAMILGLMATIIGIISFVMIMGRYDGAFKEYAKWSIICVVGLLISSFLGDYFDMNIETDRGWMKLFVILDLLPYEFLRQILYEGDEDGISDEDNDESC